MSTAKTNEILKTSMGNKGSNEITGTAEVIATSGFFTAIQFLSDTAVGSQVDAAGVTNADLSAYVSISEGTVVYGKWTSITLLSGSAIGYLG